MYVLSKSIGHDIWAEVKRFEDFNEAVDQMMEMLTKKEGMTMQIDDDKSKEFKLLEGKLR